MTTTKNEIEKYKTIKDFLDSLISKNTKRSYKSSLKKFFDFVKQNPDEYIRTDYRTLDTNGKIKIEDKYEKDITAFWTDMIAKNTPPKTVRFYIASIRVLLQHYRTNLDAVFWKKLNTRGTGCDPLTADLPITNAILEKLLIHANIKSKALFLTLSSSGMRINEALSITEKSIDLTSTPTKITILANMTKNKTRRICYTSDEATKYLKEWLTIRDEYLKTACLKTNIKSWHGTITKTPDDERIFPFDENTARVSWNSLIKKTGYAEKDEHTNRYKYHIHGLRKFFRTNFSKHNKEIAEILMGHNGYLTKEYVRYTEEEIRNEYCEGVKYLYVFDQPRITLDQQKEIDRLKEQIKDLTLVYEHDLQQNTSDIEKYQKMTDKKIDELTKIITG